MPNIKPAADNKKTQGEKNHDKMDRLAAMLMELRDEQFTGYIKINFSQGSIGRVEKFEEILKK
ncbi:MAG: hypothetical protein SWH68_03050 [Thermodesulfobacteriota bacterium]|nr:hypothetical protein [Thermodesulfobacteriota bacterium]